MYLLKLHKHRHGNSIYFTRDNMVCFPKSGHISNPLKSVGVIELEIVVLYTGGGSVIKINKIYFIHLHMIIVRICTYIHNTYI